MEESFFARAGIPRVTAVPRPAALHAPWLRFTGTHAPPSEVGRFSGPTRLDARGPDEDETEAPAIVSAQLADRRAGVAPPPLDPEPAGIPAGHQPPPHVPMAAGPASGTEVADGEAPPATSAIAARHVIRALAPAEPVITETGGQPSLVSRAPRVAPAVASPTGHEPESVTVASAAEITSVPPTLPAKREAEEYAAVKAPAPDSSPPPAVMGAVPRLPAEVARPAGGPSEPRSAWEADRPSPVAEMSVLRGVAPLVAPRAMAAAAVHSEARPSRTIEPMGAAALRAPVPEVRAEPPLSPDLVPPAPTHERRPGKQVHIGTLHVTVKAPPPPATAPAPAPVAASARPRAPHRDPWEASFVSFH